jgi:hypothetical protein
MNSTTLPSLASTRSAARTGGAALAGAGAITIVFGLITWLKTSAVPDDDWSSPYTHSAFVWLCLIAALSHALAFAGLLELRHPRYIGTSKGARIGITIALGAMAVLFVNELVGIPIRSQQESDTVPSIVGPIFGVASVAFLIGAFLAGRGAARDGAWRDARRHLLLVWAAATLPLIALGPTDDFGLGLAIWGIPMLLVGLALLSPISRPTSLTNPGR